jgi:hypothetical protein
MRALLVAVGCLALLMLPREGSGAPEKVSIAQLLALEPEAKPAGVLSRAMRFFSRFSDTHATDSKSRSSEQDRKVQQTVRKELGMERFRERRVHLTMAAASRARDVAEAASRRARDQAVAAVFAARASAEEAKASAGRFESLRAAHAAEASQRAAEAAQAAVKAAKASHAQAVSLSAVANRFQAREQASAAVAKPQAVEDDGSAVTVAVARSVARVR